VIMGVFDMMKKLNENSRMFGFLMGPKGVYANNYIEITQDYMQLYRNMGGFDMICKKHHFFFINIMTFPSIFYFTLQVIP
jgi:6-phosphofructokinase